MCFTNCSARYSSRLRLYLLGMSLSTRRLGLVPAKRLATASSMRPAAKSAANALNSASTLAQMSAGIVGACWCTTAWPSSCNAVCITPLGVLGRGCSPMICTSLTDTAMPSAPALMFPVPTAILDSGKYSLTSPLIASRTFSGISAAALEVYRTPGPTLCTDAKSSSLSKIVLALACHSGRVAIASARACWNCGSAQRSCTGISIRLSALPTEAAAVSGKVVGSSKFGASIRSLPLAALVRAVRSCRNASASSRSASRATAEGSAFSPRFLTACSVKPRCFSRASRVIRWAMAASAAFNTPRVLRATGNTDMPAASA